MMILALEFSSAQRSVAVGVGGWKSDQVVTPSPKSEVIGNSELDKAAGRQDETGRGDLDPVTSPLRTSPSEKVHVPPFASRAGWFEVVETGPGGTQAFGMIDRALQGAGIGRSEIECIAVGIGPGSYTGIRAAIAMAQGWQLATGVKLLPISSVECLAAQAQRDGFLGRADFVIDAQRNEFYLAGYEITEARFTPILPLRLATAEGVEARRAERDALFGPEARKWFSEARELFPRAETLGRMASTRTDFVPGEKIEPIYLRETAFVKAPPPRFSSPL